jgi:5'-methylthioadenosine phosphorylase
VDQFIDFTKKRAHTFFESFENGVAHTPMADPFDPFLREALIASARELNFKIHEKGTVVTIEGPRFSTRAESLMFRSWGADIINMSIATEAALANEAGLPYGAVAMSTDYDCWKDDEEPVSWDRIMEIFNDNAHRVKTLLIQTIERLTL